MQKPILGAEPIYVNAWQDNRRSAQYHTGTEVKPLFHAKT